VRESETVAREEERVSLSRGTRGSTRRWREKSEWRRTPAEKEMGRLRVEKRKRGRREALTAGKPGEQIRSVNRRVRERPGRGCRESREERMLTTWTQSGAAGLKGEPKRRERRATGWREALKPGTPTEHFAE
jgi:hypothetical protein